MKFPGIAMASVLVLAATPAVAAGGQGDAHKPSEWIRSMDADGDGSVTEQEFQAGRTEQFTQQDADGDGISNLGEWLAGTDPQDPDSYLRLDAVRKPSGGAELRFTAVANRSYTVLKAGALPTPVWNTFTNIPAATTNRSITVPLPAAAMEFYRVVTPAL